VSHVNNMIFILKRNKTYLHLHVHVLLLTGML